MKKYNLNVTGVNIIVAAVLLFIAGLIGYAIHQPEKITTVEQVEWIRTTPYVHLNSYPVDEPQDVEGVEEVLTYIHVVTVFYEFYDYEAAEKYVAKVSD